jgi:hypothetical protein
LRTVVMAVLVIMYEVLGKRARAKLFGRNLHAT